MPTINDPPRKTGPPGGTKLDEMPASSLQRIVVVASLLFLVALWASIAVALRHEREIHIAQAHRDTRNLAVAFENHVEGTITSIDALLLSLRHELQENAELPSHNDLVEWTQRGPLKESIVQIGVINAQGYLVYTSTNSLKKPIFVGDRDHFIAHKDATTDKLFVSKPIRARTTELDLIPFSRRVNGPAGQFRGVVSVLVRSEHFSRFYDSINLGSQGAVTLVRDGIVLARASAHRPSHDPVGTDISSILPPPNVLNDSRIAVSPIDGLERLIHYRRLKDQPLAVIVSMTEKDYLAEYRDARFVRVAIGTAVSAALLLVTLILVHFARRLEAARLSVAASEARYRNLFDSAPIAYQSLDRDGCIVAVNAAWVELVGVRASEAIGRPVTQFLGEHAQEILCCQVGAGSDHPPPQPFGIVRANGERRLVVLAGCTQSEDGTGASSQCVLRDVTREVAQAEALKASEARLRGIVENINVATWEFDLATWRFTYVSPQGERMFGYAAEEWLQEGFWESHLHPDDRAEAIANCVTQNGLRQDHDYEYRFIRRDGSAAWVRDIGNLIVNDKGIPDRLTGVLIDITPEKEAAAEIARQHALLRSLIDAVPDLIFFKDLNSIYLGCNRAFSEFAGRPESEQIGKSDFDFFDRETAEFFRRKDREMLESGESRRNEEWVTYPDGRTALLDTLKAPFRGEGGEALGLIGISRDITETKRAEEGLVLARSVFESTNEGIVVTDAEPRILSVNPAFTAITGWSADEAIGQKPCLLRSGRHSTEFYAAMWASLAERGHWEGEIWNRRKGGEIYVEWMTINAIRDSSGTVTRYVGLFTDITLRKNQEEKIWRQANFDPLTGLANRNLFHDRLDRALARARRNQQQVGLMFIDLDRFKWINDTLGHEAGDQLLVEAAERLQACVREEDTVARLGGDEFTIVLQGLSDPEPLQAVAEKVLATLACPFVLNGTSQYISGSLGVTIFPNDAGTTSDLLRNADIAMYEAKAAGRNRYQFYSHYMQASAQRRVEIEHDLRRAIASDSFALHYQPIIDADSRELYAAEALVRWQHPSRGLVEPAEFLAIAEDCGLIVPLGEWVIGEACRQWRAWTDAGHSPLRITINVSNLHFRHAGLRQCIADALARYAVPGHMLSLDLTEALMLGRSDELTQTLLDLDELGLHFALDDFGTGYSSLTALKCFPFDTVKIDRSFVAHIPASDDDRHMIEAIIFMAHSLNLDVVAEGVESQAQLDFLRELGCDMVQGYLLGRPLPADRFADYLGTQEGAVGGDGLADESRFMAALRRPTIDTDSWIRRLLVERNPDLASRLADERVRIGELDVSSAIVAHLQWRVRIEAMIQDDCADSLSSEEAADEHLCALGHWIDGQRDGETASLKNFARLLQVHAEFHQLTASILADLKLGRRAEARRRVRGLVFRESSHAVVTTLIDLFVEQYAQREARNR